MFILSEHEVFVCVAGLGLIIFAARVFGELAKKMGQPIIVGEVIAGIVLGHSVLEKILPSVHGALFPDTGNVAVILQGLSWLCIIFLLLMTGLEIDCQTAIRQGHQNILTSLFGLLFPFIGIFVITSFLPSEFYVPGINRGHTNLFIAISLSVVAIPVIASILFDLKILRSFVGLNIITAGVLGDIWGWSILTIVIALISQGSISFLGILKPFLTMIFYLGFALTVGRWIIDRIFIWIGLRTKEATPVLAILFSFALLNGAIAHLLGIHVIFGAFVAGIMAGESKLISSYMRRTIEDFILGVFAPIFFVLIGMQLRLDGISNWIFVFILFISASGLKILGGFIGASMGGLGRKNALAVGCGLNTQGTMGVIIALVGMELGVFNYETFTVIVLVCVLSSIFVGPSLKWAVHGVKRPLAKYFGKKHIFLDATGRNKVEIIQNMAYTMKERGIIKDPKSVNNAIWEREESMSTAIGDGVALPHARIPGFKDTIVCLFRLKKPVDFASPDNKPVQLLFLELTDSDDDGMQLNLISQIAKFVSSKKNIVKLLSCTTEEEVHHLLSFDEKI